MNEQKKEFTPREIFTPLTTLKSVHILIFIGFLLYANSLCNGFIGDDFGQLIDNDVIHTITNIPQFFFGGSFNNGNGGTLGIYYKPLMLTAFSVIFTLFGPQAFFFHFFQVILHICNSLLVFLLFKHFFKKQLSLILALIFLIHPINNEAVVYISNLQDVLFFFFGMLALLMSLKPYSQKNFILAMFFLFCSLLSKETGLVFLIIIYLYSFFISQANLKKYSITLPIIFTVYSLVHIAIVGFGFSKDQPFPIMRLSLAERLVNIPSIVFFYIKTFFYPKDLAIAYQGVIREASLDNFYIPLAVITLCITLWILLYGKVRNKQKHNSTLLFFSSILVSGMLLHIQIIPLDFVVSERWFYFPIVGLLGIIGIVISSYQPFVKKYHVIIFLCLALIMTLLSYRTYMRNFDWRNGLTLSEHDTKIVKDSYSLYAYYGTELYNAGRYDEAMNSFNQSIELAPYWYVNWSYLGLAQERLGSLTKDRKLITQAETSYLKAISNTDSDDMPYVHYSHLLVYYYDSDQAKQFLQSSLKKYPSSSGLWYNYALLNVMDNDIARAKQSAQTAFLLNPYNKDAKTLFFHLKNRAPVTVQKEKF